MSNKAAQSDAVRFEPVRVEAGQPAPGRSPPSPQPTPAPTNPRQPGARHLLWGVAYPAVVIIIELASRFCATSLFDPIPTVWHALAVAFVPAMNFVVWAKLATAKPDDIRKLALGAGVATVIGGCYALLFVPLVPLAIIGIVFYGIGLLPLAPIAAFISSACLLARVLRTKAVPRLGRTALTGVVAGFAALCALELPMVATRVGTEWAASSDATTRSRGVSLLQTMGDDDQLLRLCYGMPGRPAGPLGMLMALRGPFWERQALTTVDQTTAREIYYRVHGAAFNSVRAPSMAGRQNFADEFTFDSDHGGAAVGGRIKGLTMTSSRIDGSISGDDATAYLEWTFEFRNTSLLDRETRLEIALPPGAVVSRATLWVNGEEREAAYGGRGEVRAAYQKVAIQQRRDPLLVTTKGADRVLAQAFPVPRNGGTIKFKLGITAPLDLIDLSTGQLTLPAIFDRNFGIEGEGAHAVWIESRQPLVAGSSAVKIEGTVAGQYRATARLDDRALSTQRQTLTVTRNPYAGPRIARIGDDTPVMQEIKARVSAPGSLMIVVDGSAQLRGMVDDITRALATIPTGAKVGVMIAADPVVSLPPSAWDAAALERATRALRAHAFNGGHDNSPALAEALVALESDPNALVLWIAGPQPQAFQGAGIRLEQAISRLGHLPVLTIYPVAAGPNAVLPDVPWSWGVHMLPHLASVEADIAGFLHTTLTGSGYTIERREAVQGMSTVSDTTKGSAHIARLYVRDRVLDMMRATSGAATSAAKREETRVTAVALAASHQLITPVSGAVVLETAQQYTETGLTPVTQSKVPTVPEPHEWALIGIASLAMIWLMGRTSQTRRRDQVGELS